MTQSEEQIQVRVLDQEPDCIAIIPEHKDSMVVGTYSLQRKEGNEPAPRRGSLQIHSLMPKEHQVVRKDFEFGVYDIHFHHDLPWLLGVATSDAEVFFFRIGKDELFEMRSYGRVRVEEPIDGRVAIVTQFQFLAPVQETADGIWIMLAATTQFGNVKIMQVCLPVDGAEIETALEAQILQVHNHSFDLEAWAVMVLPHNIDKMHVLSGGDDSQLVCSEVDLPSTTAAIADFDVDEVTVRAVVSDQRTHEAGVVSLCVLDDPGWLESGRKLLLTGSYDERIRLFMLTPTSINPRSRLELLAELQLGGGVWRITVLESYAGKKGSVDYLLLIAGHMGGVLIVRLVLSHDGENEELPIGTFTIENTFVQPDNLVYAVVAQHSSLGSWNVLSSSFYDKKLYNWTWADPKRV